MFILANNLEASCVFSLSLKGHVIPVLPSLSGP